MAPSYSQHEILLPGRQVAPHRNGCALDILHLQRHVSVKLLCGSKGRVKRPPAHPPPPGHTPLPPSRGVSPHCTQYCAEWTLPLLMRELAARPPPPHHRPCFPLTCQMMPPELRLALAIPSQPKSPSAPRVGRQVRSFLPWGPSNLAFLTVGTKRGGRGSAPEPPGVPRGQKPPDLAPLPAPSCTVGKGGVIPPAGINQESPVPGKREREQAGAATSGHLETSPSHPK